MSAKRLGTVLVLAASAFIGCGGYNWQADVRRHAALDHECPVGEVFVLEHNGNELRRRVRLAVCGEMRLYLHRSEGGTYVWRDISEEDLQ